MGVTTPLLRIRPEQAEAMAPAGGPACGPCQGGPRPATEPGPALPVESPDDWIAIVLKDHGGRPLPDQAFELRLDDGTVRSGTTDAEGKARFEGVPTTTGIAHFQAIPDHAAAG